MPKYRPTNITTAVSMTVKKKPTLVVIGCGPSGMFFLHAVARLRHEYERKGDEENLLKLPVVTCFEKTPNPGGVWRSIVEDPKVTDDVDRNILNHLDDLIDSESSSESESESDSDSDNNDEEVDEDMIIANDIHPTNMYESLWMNASKECIEFFDYTYKEHFQCPLPAFLSRKQVLEYIIGRVTHKNPNFFASVQFNSTVKYVTYDKAKSKFEVTILRKNNQEYKQYFDKCIWAAGLNGRQILPKSTHNMLTNGGYKGTILHSADIGSYFVNIKDKTMLLIGDSFSAEDLTLKAIKSGVKSIIIYSRSSNGVCCETGSWPMKKVRVETEYMPYKVTNDGYGIKWIKAEFNMKTWMKEIIVGGKTYVTKNVDVIIYCTGYFDNSFMLDDDLKSPDEEIDCKYKYIPKSYTMSNNIFTKDIGHIVPSQYLDLEYVNINSGMYSDALISNPNMMFLGEGSLHTPLLEIDVAAHTLLCLVIGKIQWPDDKTIYDKHKEVILSGMEIVEMRKSIDKNYYMKHRNVYNDKHHWSYSYKDERMIYQLKEFLEWNWRYFAQDMKDCDYPVDIGDWNVLNEKGKKYVEISLADALCRTQLDAENKDSDWKTFRDLDDVSNRISIHTGEVAIPFNGPWLEVEDEV